MTSTDAPSIYPTLRYDDGPAAIRFLVDALGFGEVAVHTEEDGSVAHALLSFGNGVVMVSSRRPDGDDRFDSRHVCLYVATDDPDGHHDRAVAAGAEVVMGLVDQHYGSREYAVRDPEGHVWCFGTYRPAATVPSPTSG